MGDLNQVLDKSEKIGGPLRAEAIIFSIRNMVSACRLRMIPNTVFVFHGMVNETKNGYNSA